MNDQRIPEGVEILAFDVGETLVDESRMWSDHAHEVGVPPFTLMGVLGSLIERGADHGELWQALGVQRPSRLPTIGGRDLYSDAEACLRAAQEAGFLVAIAGNQPAGAVAQLSALSFEADFIVSSHDMGVSKPSPDFFSGLLRRVQADSGQVMYIGDRVDNDILPARATGMRTAFLRRGPWGLIHSRQFDNVPADMVLESLEQLAGLLPPRGHRLCTDRQTGCHTGRRDPLRSDKP